MGQFRMSDDPKPLQYLYDLICYLLVSSLARQINLNATQDNFAAPSKGWRVIVATGSPIPINFGEEWSRQIVHLDVYKNRVFSPKMDGLFNGKPYQNG